MHITKSLFPLRYNISSTRILLSLIFFYLFYSCGNSPYPGYSLTKNGLYYKLIDIGENTKHAKTGDYVTAQITIKSENDSVLYDTRTIGPEGAVTFILPPIEYKKDYREGFLYISEGDSAIFITDAYAFYMRKNKAAIPASIKLESPIKVYTRVLRIRTPEEHSHDMQKEKERIEKGEFEEKKALEKYLADNKITAQAISNGMYYIRIREGSGISPDSGNIALLNYRGTFLNGRCFDFFYESQPFEYMVGQKDQLIQGLEIGVRRMREGERAKFIIPSHLAYGSAGSANEIVPPFTTVIYEVELLKVQ